MTYNKIIVMPVYKRPDYTKQVLEGIKGCYGSEEYKVIICAEPDHPEVIDAINSVTGLDKEIIINPKRLQLGWNVLKCLTIGFERSDFVIIFEDDIVPSKDCLKYFEWARDTYENDKNVFNVTGYSRLGISPENYNKIDKHIEFTCWGWATWTDRWVKMKDNWIVSDTKAKEWTLTVRPIFDKSRNKNGVATISQIRPLISRTQNIGKNGGMHCLDTDVFTESVHTPYWVEYIDHDFKNVNYQEIGV